MSKKSLLQLCSLIILNSMLFTNLHAQKPEWFDKVNVLSWAVQSKAPTTGTIWGFMPIDIRDREALQEYIELHHSEGKFYHVGLPFDPIFSENYHVDSTLICYDINGQPIDATYKLVAGSRVIPNLHHSGWKDSLISWIKLSIDIGADGVTIDGYCPGMRAIEEAGGSFDDSTMFDFRNYLAAKYSQSELVDRFDIQDITIFHFGDWIKSHGLQSKWEIRPFWQSFPMEEPLMAEFWLFEWNYSAEFLAKISNIAKKYAFEKYGKFFSISDNGAMDGYYDATGVKDYVSGEFFYSWPTSCKYNNLSATQVKVGKSIGDWPVTVLIEFNDNGEFLKIPNYTKNLYKYILSDIYGAGGTAVISDNPVGPGASGDQVYSVDMDAISHFTTFIINNEFLFENLEPSSKTALVYSFTSKYNNDIVVEDWYSGLGFNWQFWGLGRILIESNIQHDVLFFNDNRFSNRSISIEELNKYNTIILPSTYCLTNEQVTLLLTYINDGGKIIAFGNIGTHDEYGKKVNRPILQSMISEGIHSYGNGFFIYFLEDIGGSYQVTGDSEYRKKIEESVYSDQKPEILISPDGAASIFEYGKKNSTTNILHMVNYNYNLTEDKFQIFNDIIVNILLDTTKTWQATCFSPDFFGQQLLETKKDSGYLKISVPRLEAYNIIVLQENQNKPKLVSRFPENDTTIIAGNQINFSVEVEDDDIAPLNYYWSINGEIDSSTTLSTYLYKKERNYSGIDTIFVNITDGKYSINSHWLIDNRPYKYPLVIFDEVHSPHFSPDSLRAIQLIINDEGPNYNPDHINSYWMGRLVNSLQKDFILKSDITAPLNLDNATDDVLFMVPCYQDISSQEREDIKNFVANGGGMIVLSTPFWGYAVADENSNTYKLFNSFGFKRSKYLLLASENQNDWNPAFYVDIHGNHPATSASRIKCILGHKLETTTDFAQIIETTDSLQVFEDLNGNQSKDANEQLQTDIGIIGVSEYGKGRVVYISWHMFANDCEYKPNNDLVSDAIKWITENINQIPTDVENSVSNTPMFFELKQNYPNPFNPTTKIEFSLPKTSNVEIKIYNMLGQEIRTLINQTYTAGNHLIIWDGTNNFGKKVSSGLYLYSMKAGDFVKVKKGLLLK